MIAQNGLQMTSADRGLRVCCKVQLETASTMTPTNAAAKTCAVCGEDVSAKPRTKDRHGRYYCNACYEQLLARKHAKRTAKPASKSHSTPSPKMARTLSDTSGEPLDLADDDDVKRYALEDSRPPRPTKTWGPSGAPGKAPSPSSSKSTPSKSRKPAK